MAEDVEGLTIRSDRNRYTADGRFATDIDAAKEATTAPQIGVALSCLEKESQRLADLARKVYDRLGPVMRPPTPVANEVSGKLSEHMAPLAKGMHVIEGQMRDTSYILENVLQSLEL